MVNKKAHVQHLKRRFERLSTSKSVWERIWQDVFDYCLPNREPIYRSSISAYDGEDRSNILYDTTAVDSVMRLAASINSLLTNEFSDWFVLEVEDPYLREDTVTKQWLEDVTDIIVNVLNNTNFYSEIHEFYIDLVSVGTAIMYIEEDPSSEDDIRFSTRHMKEIFTAEAANGKVDTVFRKTNYSIRQAVQRWGLKALSKNTQKDYKEDPDKDIEVLHCVYPREDYDVTKKDRTNKPYASMWIELVEDNIIDEGGYDEFPYIVARWSKASGETQGRSPAMSVLGNIQTLNDMTKTVVGALEKAINPPMKASPDIKKVSLVPGAINVVNPQSEGFLAPLYQVALSALNGVFTEMQSLRDSISNAFFTSQLSMVDSKQMTAEEVRARQQENMKVLGPNVGRLQQEALEPLLDKIYSILLRKLNADGSPRIPQLDVEGGGDIKVKYSSPLARAQKSNEIQGVISVFGTAMQWAQAKPEVLDNLNADAALKLFGEYQGVPTEVFFDDKTVQAMRQQRQQQMQQQRQLEIQQKQAETQERQAKTGKTVVEGKEIADGAE